MTTVALIKPIQAHGEERREIELREPSAGDISACGYPFNFVNTDSGDTQTAINTGVISAYVSRLGSIPPSSVSQLNAVDWSSCMAAVLGFFGRSDPTPEAISSTDSSISAGSGNGRQRPSSR